MAAKAVPATEPELGPLEEPEPPPPTDPRLPLDARQVFKLHKSWKGVKRDLSATGIELMIRLFRNNADVKALFMEFRGIEDVEELRVNEELERHASLLMGALDDIMDNIENVDYVIAALEKLSSSHHQRDHFTAEFFWRLETPFLDSIQLTLGDRYSDNMANIYTTTIRFILESLTGISRPTT